MSRRYPRDYESLPLWARFGFMIPMGALAFAAVVAVGCAALGGLALLFALQWYAMG